jgi:hypothetical protein
MIIKKILAATMRVDGSSILLQKIDGFPSLSTGWVITKEDFMSSTTSILNFAKLRASWGQNGNQDISPFQFSSQIVYAFPGYFFGDTKFLVQQLITSSRRR